MRGSSLTATAAAKPTPNLPTAVSCASGAPLAGGAQRGQRRDARRVQRRTCVRGHERPGAQCQPQPACHSPARRRVGRVLRQLHHDAVTVATERVVLLRVGVLAEPRGRRRPGVEHPAAQLRGAERVRLAGLHSWIPSPSVPADPARSPDPVLASLRARQNQCSPAPTIFRQRSRTAARVGCQKPVSGCDLRIQERPARRA